MTLRNGLFFENNTTGQHAQDVRLMLEALLGGTTGSVAGVGGATHFKVTERSGTPDMSVNVAAGHLFIEGSRNSAQGVYHVYNDATVNVPLSASDPTNPRIDLVYVRVRDSAYDVAFAGQDDAEIVVAEGTPAAVPAPPTITDEDYLLLARVTVGAGVSSIVNANITGIRVPSSVWTRPRGRVARREFSSSHTVSTSGYANVPGFAVTFNAERGRRYRVAVDTGVFSDNVGAVFQAQVRIGGSTVAQGGQTCAGDMVVTLHFDAEWSPTSTAQVTAQVQAHRASGTGNVAIFSAADWRPVLLIEDIGGFLV